MFGVPVYGGVKLDQPEHYEFILHDVTLTYDIPAGAWGIPGQLKRVVNYRQHLDKIETWRIGREYFSLNSAVWNYYYKFLLYRLFPVDEIGNFTYRVGLDILPSNLVGESKMERLESYIWIFLEEYLEGPNGINTGWREMNPDAGEEYRSRLYTPKPEKLDRIKQANEWVYFSLWDRKSLSTTHYFFTPLNDEFGLSYEFTPRCNRSATRAGKYINSMHEKTMQMIMNSIRLEFA
jgi:hypothetical protein